MQLLLKIKNEDPELEYAILWSDHEQKQLECVLIQTGMMRKNHKYFSDIVFMDSTFNTNTMDLALVVFTGISGEGKNTLLGISLMARETGDNYIWLLQTLLDLNENVAPKVMMTDFDSSMCLAIEHVFNVRTTHLICQWHMMQNIKKHFLYLAQRPDAASSLLYNHIIDSIYAETPARFQEMTDLIFNSGMLDSKHHDYLRNLWLIKSKWAAAYIPREFTGGCTSSARAESMNAYLKK